MTPSPIRSPSALLNHVAEMNPDAEFDAAIGRNARIALDHRVLNLDGATYGVDHAAKLNQSAVAGALNDAPMVDGDRGIDQIAAERAQPRQSSVLVRAGKSTESDHIGGQYRRKLSSFGHGTPFSKGLSLDERRGERRDPQWVAPGKRAM